jgi:hypothetical protein
MADQTVWPKSKLYLKLGIFDMVPNLFYFEKIILDQIRKNHLTCLLKCFGISKNKNKVNQNHLKHIFYRFTGTVETFQIDSPIKYFDFFVKTGQNDSNLNQKCFSLC